MAKSKYYLIEDNIEQIKKWKKFGATDKQICEQLGIASSTWYDYLNKHTDFSEAVKNSVKDFVTDLKGELARLATKHVLSTTKKYKKLDTETGHITQYTEILEKEVDANIGAIHLLLKNLNKDEWNNDWSTYELKKMELELKKQIAEEKSWS